MNALFASRPRRNWSTYRRYYRAIACMIAIVGISGASILAGALTAPGHVEAAEPRDTYTWVIDVDDYGAYDTSYKGPTTAVTHGWKAIIYAKYEEVGNPTNTFSANLILETDGTHVPHKGSEPLMRINSNGPAEYDPNCIDFYDDYTVEGDALEEYENNGKTFELVSFRFRLLIDDRATVFTGSDLTTICCEHVYDDCVDCDETVSITNGSANHTAHVELTADCS